jgi:hypothetical protein
MGKIRLPQRRNRLEQEHKKNPKKVDRSKLVPEKKTKK